ncbi:hypothetical protein HY629_03030 [Candidatus Uhrbacteria bacterium]|nr:hypothetical protein [Candidatus Uhrbacteria bacterium]
MAFFLRTIVRDIFIVGLTTFVVYFVADFAKPGFVTNYVNLNALLLFVLVFGIVTVLLYDSGDSN